MAEDEVADVGGEVLDVFFPPRVCGSEREGFAVVETRVDPVEQQGAEVDVERQGRVEALRKVDLTVGIRETAAETGANRACESGLKALIPCT